MGTPHLAPRLRITGSLCPICHAADGVRDSGAPLGGKDATEARAVHNFSGERLEPAPPAGAAMRSRVGDLAMEIYVWGMKEFYSEQK